VGENDVGHGGEVLQRLAVIAANGRAGGVAAGHDKAVGNLSVAGICKKQQLDGGVGEHDAGRGIARGHGGAQPSAGFLFQQKYGFFRPGEDILLALFHLAFPAHSVHIPHHHGKWLLRAVLQLPQTGYGILVRGVAAQVEAADALYCGDAAPADDLPCVQDGGLARLGPARNVDPGAAVVAAHRLGVEAPGGRGGIFIAALPAHGKLAHAGSHPVVGHGIKYGEAGPAVRAVDERVQVAAVAGVEKLLGALGAYGDIGRNENVPVFVGAGDYFEFRVAGRDLILNLNADDLRAVGGVVLQTFPEVFQFLGLALGVYLHV